MLNLFFIAFILSIPSIQAQDDGKPKDFDSILQDMESQMNKMIEKLEMQEFNGQMPLDSLIGAPFGNLKDGAMLFEFDAQNMEQVFDQMVQQIKVQIESLDDQDWSEFGEFFQEFDQFIPNNRNQPNHGQGQIQPKKDTKPKKITKKRKTVDL